MVIYIKNGANAIDNLVPRLTHTMTFFSFSSFSLSFLSISSLSEDAYCLLLPHPGSVEDIDDAWITVQRCKLRYDRQSLHSVRDTLVLTFFSVYPCLRLCDHIA